LLACVAAGAGAQSMSAQTPAAAPVPAEVSAEVLDALSLIENAQSETYSVGDVQRIFHAVWWDVTYGREEEALARQLAATTRPITLTGIDGRTLSFTKLPAPDAARQQRFLLPGRYSASNSSYFVDAFRNTKDAGVFIGACRVHENAASIMESALNDMINQARFQAKTDGEAVVITLFAELEAGHRDANPAIQGEFADIVRRVVGRYSADPGALPAAVRKAAWLQPPGG
jgi:hypothetical protein